jgi:UDP-N-acetylmuramate dehydrogenase
MKFLTDNNLAHYTTMRIGGPAKVIAEVNSEQDIVEAVKYAKNNNLKLITIGKGANIIFKDIGFDGLVIVNRIPGIKLDSSNNTICAGGGARWDDIVKTAVEANLYGVESLSVIPSTAGAAPVNNIGAYGQEISDTLISVRAYDTKQNKFVEIPNKDCGFSYRNSCFKNKEHGRYIICGITLKLQSVSNSYQAPGYPKLKNQGIANPTPQDVRETITKLRYERLPNPSKLPNAGSFFKNPIVSVSKLKELQKTYSEIPHYPQKKRTRKISRWLVNRTNWSKGFSAKWYVDL